MAAGRPNPYLHRRPRKLSLGLIRTFIIILTIICFTGKIHYFFNLSNFNSHKEELRSWSWTRPSPRPRPSCPSRPTSCGPSPINPRHTPPITPTTMNYPTIIKLCSFSAIYHINYATIQHSKPTTQPVYRSKDVITVIILLLSGDIQLNPGPVQFPCSVCQKAVAKNHRALQCDSCDTWTHIKCDGITPKEYKLYQNHTNPSYNCPTCTLQDATDLSSTSSDDLRNTSNTTTSSHSHSPQHSTPQTPLTNNQQQNDKYPKQTIRIMTVNCRSLQSQRKRMQLQELIETHKPDIIAGTESHLDSSITTSETFPNNYQIFRKDRNIHGGGVFLAVNNTFIATQQTNLDTDAEIIWAKIQIDSNTPLFVSSVYRPPDGNHLTLEHLHESINTLTNNTTNPNMFITGDFNLPSIDWDNHKISQPSQYSTRTNQILLDTADSFFLSQTVKTNTRQSNILDLVFTTCPSLITKSEVYPGMSDHNIVITDIKLKASTNKKIPRNVFIFKKANFEGLKDEISSQYSKFKQDFNHQTIEQNWQKCKSIILTATEKYIPSKTVRGKRSLPWFNNNIKRDIRRKQRYYNKAKQTDNENDWKLFKRLRSKIKRALKTAHRNYITNLLDTTKNNKYCIGKRFWSYVKAMRKDDYGVLTLIVNGTQYSNNKQKAQILNNQFESIFTNENTGNLPKISDKQYPKTTHLQIQLAGVTKLLKNINTSKANGPDNIPCRVLKEAADQIAPYLQLLYQQSINTGTLPQDWLTANIIPIYKKGDPTLASNYRPISLTSVPCKILEHILYSHIIHHLNTHNILTDSQHGFRTRRSCETQLIVTIDNILKEMDQSNQVDTAILDFSKAFDTVPHQRLLLKLKQCGINNQLHRWIEQWLTTRTQRVVLDGEASNMAHVKSGVPQGTVLGPLMFLIFVNDINKDIQSNIRLFADDCLMYHSIKNPHHSTILQNDLNTLTKWADTWQMEFNISKCHIMHMHNKKSPIIQQYTMHGKPINTTKHHPYLGIELSSDLSWDNHINNITSKSNKVLGFIRRNLHNLPPHIKQQAYFTLVRPHLEFASSSWDPFLQKHIECIEKIQRRAARFVTKNYINKPGTITNLLKELQWPTLKQRRTNSRLTTMYKITHNLIDIKLPSYIQNTNRTTRQHHPNHFKQPAAKTNKFKFSYFPKTIKEWNALPITTIDKPSLLQFKSELYRSSHSS